MTRRGLIAATAPLMMAAEGKPKVRVGLLGSNHSHFSGKLKAVQSSPLYDVVGIAEYDPARQPPPGLPVLTSDQLLADKTINLVVVECRVWEALPQGQKVIGAGKHLHIEKPPGNDYAAFKALIEEARRKKLLVQTGYVWRKHPAIDKAMEAAKNGWLGEIFMVRGTMNADRGPAEREVEGHYKGGGMFELSGHMIDRVVELLGRPKAVKSWLRHDTSVNDKLADNNLAVFEFDKALAVISQANKMAGSGDHRSFEIIGTDGTFVIHPESTPVRLSVYMRNAKGEYKQGWQNIQMQPQPRFVADFEELGLAIQNGVPLKHSYDHELLLHETLLRASGEKV